MTIILVGKQASGKTSAASELRKMGYAPILECTTREKRPSEEDGVQYHFVTEDEYNALDLITDNKFPTVGGMKSWGFARKDLVCEDDSDHIIVAYPAACKKILDSGIKDCIVVCLYADRKTQISRLKARGDDEEIYMERMVRDDTDFLDLDCHFLIETDNTSTSADTAKMIDSIAHTWKHPYLKKVHTCAAFITQRNKILIDDVQSSQTDGEISMWSQVCEDCAHKYKKIFGSRLGKYKGEALGRCHVHGCTNDSSRYIDFEPDDTMHLKF